MSRPRRDVGTSGDGLETETSRPRLYNPGSHTPESKASVYTLKAVCEYRFLTNVSNLKKIHDGVNELKRHKPSGIVVGRFTVVNDASYYVGDRSYLVRVLWIF